MYLLDVVPLTKIPSALPQILSYFSGVNLPAGAIVQIPLGRRQEKSVVIESRPLADFKMAVKQADYELRNISRIISAEPVLTPPQTALAIFLGQYYFTAPGLFAKMMMPKSMKLKAQSSKLKQNQKSKAQKLIIAPTISQTEQIAAHYKNGVIWHSGLKQRQLNETWWQVENGETRIIIGTRSAIFLPFANLKEIIIEDETNPNHRSWDMFPYYRVHEAAQKLAEIFSATLSLRRSEATKAIPWTAEKSRDRHVASLRCAPRDGETTIVDLRAEIKEGNFSILSRALQTGIKNTLAEKKPVVLFINRRGAANFVLCRDCGYVAKCANCDAPLAYHLVNGRPTLLCHRCGAKDAPPSTCPKCQSWRVKTVGGGTQKAELETKKLFPDAKIARLDSDTAPNSKDQQKIIEAFAKKEIDILITTQIIFSWTEEIKKAKPGLVALLFADTLLHLPDFRSGERTFQMITSLSDVLARRSEATTKQSRNVTAVRGIATAPFPAEPRNDHSTFIIQTYSPENTVIQRAAQNDWSSFWQEEMETRQALNYPPFSQIVKLTFRHRDPKKAGQEAKILVAKLKNVVISPSFLKEGWGGFYKKTLAPNPPQSPFAKGEESVEVSDALPAFIPKEKGQYIWNIILKFFLPAVASPALREGRGEAIPNEYLKPEFLNHRNSLLQYVPSNWEIDVDPENLL